MAEVPRDLPARAPAQDPRKQDQLPLSLPLLGSSFLLPSAASSCADASANLAFPEAIPADVSRRLLALRFLAIFGCERAFARARLLGLLARALFFLVLTFMVTWDKTLLFTPSLVNSNHYFCNIFACLQVSAKMDMVMFCLRAAPGHLRLRVFA